MRWTPLLFLVFACGGPSDDSETSAFQSGPPIIQEVRWECDSERLAWTLDVRTTHWSAGAWLWLTRDTSYVERHEVPSVGAATDGSADNLRAGLAIAADWRLVNPGSSTAFVCDEPPDVFIEVRGFQDQPSACASRGDLWSQLADFSPCESATTF